MKTSYLKQIKKDFSIFTAVYLGIQHRSNQWRGVSSNNNNNNNHLKILTSPLQIGNNNATIYFYSLHLFRSSSLGANTTPTSQI
jgi:hypothetical protein